MNPNTTLAEARIFYLVGNLEAAARAYAALDAWLARGGFQPDWSPDTVKS